MNQQPHFHTAFQCDRCESLNAIRYQIATREDYKGDSVKQDVDLCHNCVMAMGGLLMNRLPKEERQNWIKAFLQGIIR